MTQRISDTSQWRMFVFQQDPLQSCKHVSLNMFVRAIDVTYQELSFRHGYWPFIVYVFAWHRRWLSSQATDLLVIRKGHRWTSTGRQDVSSFAHLGILTAAPRFDLSKPHEATQVNRYRQKIPHELETHRFLYEVSLGFFEAVPAVGCWVIRESHQSWLAAFQGILRATWLDIHKLPTKLPSKRLVPNKETTLFEGNGKHL